MSDFMTGLMESWGYAGVFFLMVLENIFPPIPSEIVMPMAGYAAERGDLTLIGVIISGSLGSFVGILPWYWLGRALGHERLRRLADRYGRFLLLSGEDVDGAKRWFDRHGRAAVFFGRLVPGVRTLVSAPAGAAEMRFGLFCLLSAVGTAIWASALAVAGYMLGASFQDLSKVLDPIAQGVLVVLVVGYLWAVLRRRRPAPRPHQPPPGADG